MIRRIRAFIGARMFSWIYFPGIIIIATAGLLFEQKVSLRKQSIYWWSNGAHTGISRPQTGSFTFSVLPLIFKALPFTAQSHQ